MLDGPSDEPADEMLDLSVFRILARNARFGSSSQVNVRPLDVCKARKTLPFGDPENHTSGVQNGASFGTPFQRQETQCSRRPLLEGGPKMTPFWHSYSPPLTHDLEHPSHTWRMPAARGRVPKRVPFRGPSLGASGEHHKFFGPNKGPQKALPF